MLDWLGNVTSTVSFSQLSGGVCYPMNLCVNFQVHVALCQTYDSVKLCILYRFCMIFCPVLFSMSNLLFSYRV